MGNVTAKRFSTGSNLNSSMRSSVNQNKHLFDPARLLDEFYEEKKTPFYNVLKRKFGGEERAYSKNLYEPTRDRTDDEVELLFHFLQQQSRNIQRCYGYARVNDDMLELLCKYNTGYKQVLAFFEYPANGNLDAEIQKRFTSRVHFHEEDLWNLMKSLLLAEVHLEYIDCYHPDLRPLNVYLTDKRDSYKLSNPFLNDLFLDFMVGHKQEYIWSGKTRKLTMDGRKVIDPDIFYAKKKFARRYRKKNLIEIALVVLSAATLTPFIKFYVNPTSFNYLGIEKNFNTLQENYSQQLSWVLKFLFTVDDLKWKGIRKDILQVIDYIQQNAKVDFKIQLPANTNQINQSKRNSQYPPMMPGNANARPRDSMYDGMGQVFPERSANHTMNNRKEIYDDERADPRSSSQANRMSMQQRGYYEGEPDPYEQSRRESGNEGRSHYASKALQENRGRISKGIF